jgi:hypothetical protein
MKYSIILMQRALNALFAPIFLSIICLFSQALAQTVGQLTPTLETRLWNDWIMGPEVTSSRLFLKSDREILQSSESNASFQKGSFDIVLADGAVNKVWRDQVIPFFDEWDSDKDGWRDVVETDAEPPTDPSDPLAPYPAAEPDVYWTRLANGTFLPVDVSELVTASLVRPFSAPNVTLSAIPGGSTFARSQAWNDYSTQFYIINPASLSYELFGISLYNIRKEYPNPGDVASMERDVLPGSYAVEFPVIPNQYIRSGLSVGHTMVPNGSLSIGTYKKPTWLVRTAETIERLDRPPVPQSWVNGRLRFDPDRSTTFKWDDIVKGGFANASKDELTISIQDEDGDIIWPPTGGEVVSTLTNPQATLLCPSVLTYWFGQTYAKDLVQQSRNGFLVLKYRRNAVGGPIADLSSVTLRVPVEMKRSFTTFRKVAFPGIDSDNDLVSGPNADPDMDGLTNLEEFEQGGNPRLPSVGVSNPVSTKTNIDPYSETVSLGATLLRDLDSVANITISERGVVYAPSSTNIFPLIDGVGVSRVSDGLTDIGAFTVEAVGLTPGTEYSFHGYAITSNGVYYTSETGVFTTRSVPPVTIPSITSPTYSNVTGVSATLGGNVTSDGDIGALIEKGVVFSQTNTNDNPFIGSPGVTNVTSGSGSTGMFTVNVSGLTPGVSYSFRAYATNNVGTVYTSTIGNFNTPNLPTIISPTSTSITSTSAILGGNVTSNGGAEIQQRGVIFSATNPNPVIGGAGVTSFSAASPGTGIFSVNVNLLPGRTYFYKAFARNISGTSLTAVASFVTPAALPSLSNPSLSNITAISAALGAEVTGNGGGAIIGRGFVYSVTASNSNPVIGGPAVFQVSASGAGSIFSSNISPLLSNTGYTFKAYAINSAGTAYGSPYAFFTSMPPLSVTLPTVSDVTSTAAILGGTVNSDGGTIATERGIVYSSTNSNPLIDGPDVTKIIASGTMGLYTVNVTSLVADKKYYFKAYATTDAGTSYSIVSDFSTQPLPLPVDFRVTGFTLVSGGSAVRLVWNSEAGATYRIETSPTLLANSWVSAASGIPSNGASTAHDLTRGTATTLFYRIVKE